VRGNDRHPLTVIAGPITQEEIKMNEQTIVAVYDTVTDADAAMRDLEAANVPSGSISRHGRGSENTTTTAPARDEGFWAKLFGSEPEHDTSVYDRSIDSGSSVLTVRVPGEQVDCVSQILEIHNPIDLDERSANFGATDTPSTAPIAAATMPRPVAGMQTGVETGTGTGLETRTGVSPTTTSEGGTIQLAEESLSVGKRAVSGGTTRIRRYTVETPVEEQVSLRDETVTMERRPVTDGRPVGSAEFSDKVVEMTETREEAVVSKSARVVEEVNLRKDVTDHVETVKDTVRRDEVEIEKVPGESVASRGTGGMTPVRSATSPKI
jgi:uncharacterized protein (TIGR02271 family)